MLGTISIESNQKSRSLFNNATSPLIFRILFSSQFPEQLFLELVVFEPVRCDFVNFLTLAGNLLLIALRLDFILPFYKRQPTRLFKR